MPRPSEPIFQWQDYPDGKWSSFDTWRPKIYKVHRHGFKGKILQLRPIKCRESVYRGYEYIVELQTDKGTVQGKLWQSGIGKLHLSIGTTE